MGWQLWKVISEFGDRAKDAATDAIFKGANDLVVDTEHMTTLADGRDIAEVTRFMAQHVGSSLQLLQAGRDLEKPPRLVQAADMNRPAKPLKFADVRQPTLRAASACYPPRRVPPVLRLANPTLADV